MPNENVEHLHDSDIKKNKIMELEGKWMKLKTITLSMLTHLPPAKKTSIFPLIQEWVITCCIIGQRESVAASPHPSTNHRQLLRLSVTLHNVMVDLYC